MTKVYGCPNCYGTEVEITMIVMDTVVFSGKILDWKGRPYAETEQHLKDYCGDSNEVSPMVKCRKCGHQFDYTDEGILQDANELT